MESLGWQCAAGGAGTAVSCAPAPTDRPESWRSNAIDDEKVRHDGEAARKRAASQDPDGPIFEKPDGTQRDERRKVAEPGGRRDRLIAIARRTLPVAAGVLAAVMLLVPSAHREETSLILDRGKVAVTDQRIAVSRAHYTGRDDRGRLFSITADSAMQRSAAKPLVELQGMAAQIQLSDGIARIEAAGGTYDFGAQLVKVPERLDVLGPQGYRLVTSNVVIDLRAQRLNAAGGIAGTLPAGTFSADSMTADLERRVVTLRGHARLRMTPGKVGPLR